MLTLKYVILKSDEHFPKFLKRTGLVRFSMDKGRCAEAWETLPASAPHPHPAHAQQRQQKHQEPFSEETCLTWQTSAFPTLS